MRRGERPITGTHLFQRERCARVVWLEFHGDATEKRAPDAKTAAAMARGRAHEDTVMATMPHARPEYPARDFDAGARATAALLRDGAPLVYQGVLAAAGRVGMPDLLRRVDGADGAAPRYVVGDVKASLSAKLEHAMQVAFYADLLAASGIDAPPNAFLILGDGSEATIALDELAPLYREAIDDVEALRAGRREPRATLTPHCTGCAWRGVCVPAMEARGDLSLVVGVSAARRDALEDVGIRTLDDLAACDPGALADRTELPRETLRRLAFQAESLRTRAPHRVAAAPWKGGRIALVASTARDPRSGHVAELLAYRTWSEARELGERWIHEHAPSAADEGAAYRKFLSALAEDRDAPIDHFGPEFPDVLSALDARHGRRGDPIGSIFARLRDVQAGVKSSLVLPVHRYDLESVARALGVAGATEVIAQNGDAPANGDDDARAARRRLAEELLRIRLVRIAASRWTNASATHGASAAALAVAP